MMKTTDSLLNSGVACLTKPRFFKTNKPTFFVKVILTEVS